METVTGYIDATISFCPYCGAELNTTSFIYETKCDDCGKTFYVVEGEGDTE